MWWLLFVGCVIAFLIFCVLHVEFRGHRAASTIGRRDAATNHVILHQQSDSLRNQSGFL